MAKILIVDDDPNCVDIIARFLTDEGHDVRTFESGWAAMQEARPFRPDLVIADWLLKDGSNGLTVATTFRELHPGLSIIFISGLPRESLEEELGDLSAAEVLEKPLNIDALLTAVARMLARAADQSPSGRT
jgi:DNA-binding response OmpR family regulator